MEDVAKRSRSQVDYALLANGKGIPLEKYMAPKQRKLIAIGKPKRGRPVKIKLRRSLAGHLTQNNVASEVSSSRPKRTRLRSIVLDRYGDGAIKTPQKRGRRGRPPGYRSPLKEETPKSFPPVHPGLVNHIVDFRLPQQMVDDYNLRKKEVEDKTLKVLADAVRTLREINPSTFAEKFGELNHLFEESPRNGFAVGRSNSTPQKVAVVVPKSGDFGVSVDAVDHPTQGLPSLDELGSVQQGDADKTMEKRPRGRPKGTVRSPTSAQNFVRPRGRPKGSFKVKSPEINSPPGMQKRRGRPPLKIGIAKRAPTALVEEKARTIIPRAGRERASNGFYRALNSMTLPADYRLNSTRDRDALSGQR